MTIGALLDDRRSAVITIDAGQEVEQAVARLSECQIGAMPVLKDGRLVGIFSERDVLHGLARHGAAILTRPVREVMTTPPITVGRNDSVLAALALITHRRVRHLPVVEGGELIGLVSIGDLVKSRIDGIEAEASAMRAYITQS